MFTCADSGGFGEVVELLRYWKHIGNDTIKKNFNEHGKETIYIVQAGRIFWFETLRQKIKDC